MTQYLTFVAGEAISLDGAILPGIVTRIEVDGVLELEKKRLEGSSMKVKMARGFHDATVTLTLEILPPDADAQVKQLEAAFKKNYASKAPKPMRIVNPRLDSRGITSVLFRRLHTVDGNEDDAVVATCEFVEYIPQIVNAENANKPPVKAGEQALPSGQAGAGGAAAPKNPALQGLADGSGTARRTLGDR